jgi:antitoxin HicB
MNVGTSEMATRVRGVNRGATRGYPVEIEAEDDGTFTVIVPDLPGCVAAGDSPEEALAEVGDAIDSWIESAKADDVPIPVPSRRDFGYSGRFLVRIPRSLHREAAHRAKADNGSLNHWCATALTRAVTLGAVEVEVKRMLTPARLAQREEQPSGFDWRLVPTEWFFEQKVDRRQQTHLRVLSFGSKGSKPIGLEKVVDA